MLFDGPEEGVYNNAVPLQVAWVTQEGLAKQQRNETNHWTDEFQCNSNQFQFSATHLIE